MSADPSERILALCPTHRDRLHFARPELRAAYCVNFLGSDEETHDAGFDIVQYVQEVFHVVRESGYRGIVGIDDFPASAIAALVGEDLGLSTPSFESVFLCQHKYYSRLRQQEATPEATPHFDIIDLSRRDNGSLQGLQFPAFVKPAKSYLSILARRVDTMPKLQAAIAEARRRLPPIATLLDTLVELSELGPRYRTVPAAGLLVEQLVGGQQVTLDGYVWNGQMTPLGVVDSHFYPGTLSFQRFEYPSRLPPGVQERMALIAERCVKAIGLDRTFFNIEFFYHPETDHIWTIEVNGRMSSQFTPLYRMVHGIDIYAMQLDMALGRSPKGNMIWAPGRNGTVAASFVLRSFEDRLVLQAPSDEDLERVKRQCPEVFVEVLVHEGHRLSDELQDDESYRYALVDLCAKGWESLSQRFEEVRQLLPFTLAPLPVAVQKR